MRRLAHEAGVDLAAIARSGRHDRATVADVEAARRPGRQQPPPSSPLLSVVEVDVTNVTRSRPGELLAFVAEAAVRASAAASPGPVHLSLEPGAGRPAGPLASDARDLTVDALARRIAGPEPAAPAGVDAGDTGPTLTVVDVGDRQVLIGTAALPVRGRALTVGAVVRRPVVRTDRDGQEGIAVRAMAHLALSHDEADLDGVAAGRLLSAVKDRLEGWRPEVAGAAVTGTPG